jgi:hypothetical protein
MTAFLKKYKPGYWVANDAVLARVYLINSILRRATDKAGRIVNDSYTEDGITFTNVMVNSSPGIDGFLGYRQLFKLNYQPGTVIK